MTPLVTRLKSDWRDETRSEELRHTRSHTDCYRPVNWAHDVFVLCHFQPPLQLVVFGPSSPGGSARGVSYGTVCMCVRVRVHAYLG